MNRNIIEKKASRWIALVTTALVTLVAVAYLGMGCSKADGLFMRVELLYLIILEQKDDYGNYRVKIQVEENGKEEDYKPIVRNITNFDEVYKPGRRYQIVVKLVQSEDGEEYIWTKEYWPQ